MTEAAEPTDGTVILDRDQADDVDVSAQSP